MGNQSVIVLNEVHNRCPTKVDTDDLRLYFEKEFIDRLHEPSVSRSAKVKYIWGWPRETSEVKLDRRERETK